MLSNLNEKKLSRLQLFGMLGLAFVLAVSMGLYFTLQHVAEYESNMASFKANTLREQETLLKSQVEATRNYLDYVRSRTETVLKADISSQVDQVFQLATAIYQREKGRRSTADIKQLIVEAIRPMRFYQGRGYFFIDDMDGNCILLPTVPKLEGTSLLNNLDDTGFPIMRGLIEAAANPTMAGFSHYRWYPPGSTTEMKDKIAYVRLFAPFNWIIGTGEYRYKVEEDLQQEALERLRNQHFGRNGYFSIIRRDGTVLLLPTVPTFEGKQVEQLGNPAERTVFKQILDAAAQGGGLLQYQWPHPATGLMAPKMSIVSKLDSWDWIIIAGVYLDDLQSTLDAQREMLHDSVRSSIVSTLLILLAAFAVALVFSLYFSRWMGRLFGRYRTDIEHRNAALHESAKELYFNKFVMDNAADMFFLLGQEGQFVYANRAAREQFGGGTLLGLSWTAVGFAEWPLDASGQAQERRFESALMRDGQAPMPVEVSCSAVQYEGLRYLCVIVRDISERKSQEEQLQLAYSVYNTSSESMMVTDSNNIIIAINPAFTRTTGYAESEIIGNSPSILNSGRQDKSFYRQMWESINSSGHWEGEIWNRRKNGDVYIEWQTINTTFNDDGTPHRRVALFSDITKKKQTEELIWQQANYDALTGLPNRRLFHDRLASGIKKAHRSGLQLALMFIDLDHFKEVNDTLGHAMGDVLLIEAARRINACVRESDTLARQGGDEFILLLTEVGAVGGVERVAQSILDALAAPFHLGSELAYLTGSIGITLFPNDATEIDELFKNADQAMYVAKEEGRNRYSHFTRELQDAAQNRMRMINDLRGALDAQQFRVYVQPIVELATGHIHKAEALIRWLHPERGMVSPAEFIALAEETGMIVDIGNWVFRESANWVKHWRTLYCPEFQISVNKSPVQFANDGSSHEEWSAYLQELGLPGQSIAIEITEGVLLHADANIAEKLLKFRAAGFQVAIDDFGTGYSSLSYLKKFDVDYLKIDQSFVRDLASDPNDMALSEAIIVMAHKLGLKVIAEGVETEQQRALLAAAGCDYAQGYLFSRPVPAEQFFTLLEAATA